MVDYYLRQPDNPSQPLILRANQKPFVYSPYFATFAAGGWGSRKTWSGLGFMDQSIFLNPGCTGIVMAPTYKLTRELINRYVRPALGPMIVGESRQDETLYLADGGRIIYLSGHIPERIEMYTAAWAYLDEAALMKRSIFTRIIARLRDPRARKLRLGLTSVPHWCWLKEEFEDTKETNRKILRLRTSDNVDLHGDTEANLISSTSARMAACHLDGHFVPPGGAVHPGFDESNFIDWKYSRDHETIVIIDPSPRTPGIIFAQVLPSGTILKDGRKLLKESVVVFDELILGGPEIVVTTPDACRKILSRNYQLSRGIMDPAAKGVEATSGKDSLRQVREQLKIPVLLPPKAMRGVEAGIEHVNLALEPYSGHPTLFVARHLEKEKHPRGVVNSLRSISYPMIKEGKPLDTKPHKDGITEHADDCVRYLVVTVLPKHERLLGPKVRDTL